MEEHQAIFQSTLDIFFEMYSAKKCNGSSPYKHPPSEVLDNVYLFVCLVQ